MITKIELDVSQNNNIDMWITENDSIVHKNNEPILYLFANWINNADGNSVIKDFVEHVNNYYREKWSLDKNKSQTIAK